MTKYQTSLKTSQNKLVTWGGEGREKMSTKKDLLCDPVNLIVKAPLLLISLRVLFTSKEHGGLSEGDSELWSATTGKFSLFSSVN